MLLIKNPILKHNFLLNLNFLMTRYLMFIHLIYSVIVIINFSRLMLIYQLAIMKVLESHVIDYMISDFAVYGQFASQVSA